MNRVKASLNQTEIKIFLALSMFLIILPIITQNPYLLNVMILIFVYIVLALSWNLMVGYTGILSLGHAAFFGAGAYASAILTLRLNVPVWIGIVFAGSVSAFLGLIICVPCLRIKGIHYQAMVTLAFSEVLRLICSNWIDMTRGELGLWGFPGYPSIVFPGFGEIILDSKIGAYYLTLILFVIVYMILYWILKSKIGLKFMAIRDDEDASESVGIDTTKLKIISFVISSFIAGVAGSFYAHFVLILSPSVLSLQQTTFVIVGALFGGLGTTFGPILGVFTAMFASELLRPYWLEGRYVIWGFLILLVMLFIPSGLIGIGAHLKKWLTTS
jgi:branched-chain amino acid transport system permease protein